jgi:dihydropyrimidinase
MSTVIKGGTVVTADLSYEADVLVENGVITEIGPDLKGDEVLDATGCYVMPGGIDPHVHLEMPFMGTYSSDDFESGTRAALAAARRWSWISACPIRAGPARRDQTLGQQVDPRELRLFLPHGCDLVGRAGLQRHEDGDRGAGDHHVQAFPRLQGRADGERRRDLRIFQPLSELGGIAMVHAENGDVVAEMTAKLLAEGNTGPEAHAYSRPSQVEGEATNRAIMIADMAGVPLYVVHVSCEEAHEAIRRARSWASASGASR